MQFSMAILKKPEKLKKILINYQRFSNFPPKNINYQGDFDFFWHFSKKTNLRRPYQKWRFLIFFCKKSTFFKKKSIFKCNSEKTWKFKKNPDQLSEIFQFPPKKHQLSRWFWLFLTFFKKNKFTSTISKMTIFDVF